jgi:L-xylulokinase
LGVSGGYLVGVDAGHTVIKAAVFDERGALIGSGARPTATFSRHPRWQERDMDAVWTSASGAIGDALVDAGIDGSQVVSVGIGAHGDGLYLVDADLRPVRAAILATDSRAASYCDRWNTGEVAERLMAITGQVPAPYTPSATLSWLRDHEPDSFADAAHMLFCKDWLRLQLTGEVATDPTEASAGLCDVRARQWSPEAIELCGLTDAAHLLPPILPSGAVAGQVTDRAAELTGLRPGTPVITGSHDVHAAALGIGALTLGSVSAIMGTFNINQLVGPDALPSWQWQARASLTDGRFLLMSTSPAGATAVDWVRQVTAQPSGIVGEAVSEALADRGGASVASDDPYFLPFVYGTMLNPAIRGAFTGLGSWHGPADMLRAGLEGVVFTHRYHLEALRGAGPIDTRPVRLAGGGARSAAWTQLFADATGLSVEVTDAVEAGARGAAMLAGVGAGVFGDVDQAARACVTVVRTQHPRPERKPLLDMRYRTWSRTSAALQAAETAS